MAPPQKEAIAVMIHQINRLLILLLTVGVALYIALINRDVISLKLSPTYVVSTFSGFIFIGVFLAGFICAFFFTLVTGIRGYVRESRLRAHDRSRRQLFQRMVDAHAFAAAGDYARARDLWNAVLNKDSENTLARIELSKALEHLGEPREALQVLESARLSGGANLEALLRSAELHAKTNNKTAGLDTVKRALETHESPKALALARRLSEELGLHDDASEFQSRLEALEPDDKRHDEARARIAFGKLTASEYRDGEREELLAFVKRYPWHSEGTIRLAELEQRAGRTAEAAEVMIRHARAKKSAEAWLAVSNFWLGQSEIEISSRVDKAIAAAKSGVADLKGDAEVEAQLNLIHVLLTVNRAEDAKKVLDGVLGSLKRDGAVLGAEPSRRLTALHGLCLHRLRLESESAALWESVALGSSAGQNLRGFPNLGLKRNEPSPVFSTP